MKTCVIHKSVRTNLILIISALRLLFPSSYNFQYGPVSVQAFDIGIPLTAIDTFYRTSPYASAFITCGVKASLADIVAHSGKNRNRNKTSRQRLSAHRIYQGSSHLKNINRRTYFPSRKTRSLLAQKENVQRNLAYLLYGGLYQGMAQEYLYNEIFPVLFGHGLNFGTVVKKIVFDLGVVAPLVTLPLMYVIKAAIFRKSLKKSMASYIDDIKNQGLLKYFWLLWIPMKFLKFTLIPEHLRITFLAMVSFFWMIIFASITEKKKTCTA